MHNATKQENKKKVKKQLVMESYKEWQASADGNSLTTNTISQQLSHIENIIEDSRIGEMDAIFSESAISNLFNSNVNDKKWGNSTAATYLFSLNNIFKYFCTTFFTEIYEQNYNKFTMPLNEIKEKASTMVASTLRWARTHNKQSRVDSEEKYENERVNLITPVERQIIKYGSLYKLTMNTIKKPASLFAPVILSMLGTT